MGLGPERLPPSRLLQTEMRSRYQRTSALGHNTIVIDNSCQPRAARASIIREAFEEQLSLVVIDLSTAYPGTVSVSRGFTLINRLHVLIVDEIVSDTSLPILCGSCPSG
jgi:hypothetical protein